MSNQKNTIYLVIFLIFILLALVGWFIIRGQSNTAIFPAMPHGTNQPLEINPEEKVVTDTTPISILEPVPEGAGHSTQGWKQIKGSVPVVIQTSDAVSKIVFYLDRNIVGEVTGPPFDFELDTAKYTDCMYLLRVKAYNGNGKELGEDRSQIWIDNMPTNCTNLEP